MQRSESLGSSRQHSDQSACVLAELPARQNDLSWQDHRFLQDDRQRRILAPHQRLESQMGLLRLSGSGQRFPRRLYCNVQQRHLANGMALSSNYEEDNTIFVLDIATGLYRSSNAGRSWSRVEEVDTAKVVGKPVLYRKLGVSPEFGDDGLIFLFSVPRKILGVTEKLVWKFNDKTKELKQISIGGDRNYINGFAFSPQGSKQKLMLAATAQGPFVSKDEGDSWQQLSRNGAQQLFVSPDLERDGLIYLMDNKGRMQVSTDTGQSFKSTKLNLEGRYIDNLTFSPNYASDHTLFAPAVDGVYRSIDDGKTWANVLNQVQFLPKVPLLTLKDPTGQEIPLVFGGQCVCWRTPLSSSHFNPVGNVRCDSRLDAVAKTARHPQ